MPLIRDKAEGHASLETIVSAIVNGCVFGKLCLYPSKDQRKWLYNAITLTDTFVVRIHRQDVLKMVDNQKRRILLEQMNFIKQIPSPDFTLLSKKKL